MNKIIIAVFLIVGSLCLIEAAPQFEGFKLPTADSLPKMDGINNCIEQLKKNAPAVQDCYNEKFDKSDITGYLSRTYECLQAKVSKSLSEKAVNECIPESVRNLSAGKSPK